MTDIENEPIKSQHAEKRYEEICENIRTLDGNSFRLLQFVPLVTTAAILGLSFLNIPFLVLWLISWVGAAVTFGLYRWEMRNVQICKWLQELVDGLERNAFGVQGKTQFAIRLHKRDEPVSFKNSDYDRLHYFLGISFTQRRAEGLIYGATILAWLAMPSAVSLSRIISGFCANPK